MAVDAWTYLLALQDRCSLVDKSTAHFSIRVLSLIILVLFSWIADGVAGADPAGFPRRGASRQRGQRQPAPLSPLQAYLYSNAALNSAVAVSSDTLSDLFESGQAGSRVSPHSQTPSAPEQQHQQLRSVVPAYDLGDGVPPLASGEPICSPPSEHPSSPSSSSSSSLTSAQHRRAALARSLTGRYVVLSRAAVAEGPSLTPLDNREDPAAQTGRGGQAAPSPLPKTPQVLPLDDGAESSAQSGSSAPRFVAAHERGKRRPNRVYPDDALRQLAASLGVGEAAPSPLSSRPGGTAAEPLHDTPSLDNSNSSKKEENHSSTDAQADVTAMQDAHPELEMHVIDATHILVYLPPSATSARLLAAMAADAGRGVAWRVWDPFSHASGGSPRLKLSAALRSLLEDAHRPLPPPTFFSSSSASSPSSTSFSVAARDAMSDGAVRAYEVTLWTARGAAADVRAALKTSPRLQPYVDSAGVSASSSSAVCRLVFVADDSSADAVPLRLLVSVPPHGADASDSLECTTSATTAATTATTPSTERSSGAAAASRERHDKANTTNSSSASRDDDDSSNRRSEPSHCLAALLERLAAHPAVRWVEESYRHPELLNNVATRVIQHGSCSAYSAGVNTYAAAAPDTAFATPLWDLGFNGSGEIIAIADSGVDTTSCFFRDPLESIAYYPAVNLRHRKVVSYQAYINAKGVVDTTDLDGGHGTHVAGTACGYTVAGSAAAAGSSGMSAHNGVAPAAKLFVRDLNGGSAKDLSLPTNIYDIFDTAYAVGARISSNSWGFRTDTPSYLAIEKMVDALVVRRRNQLVLVAAGNKGRNNLYVPGRAKNVLTIGSHLNSPLTAKQNTVPPGSSYGPTYDGRRKPDLVTTGGGDGTKLHSARATSTTACEVKAESGTSMATAAAAGAAAIVRQLMREHYGFADPASALLRAAMLQATASMDAEERRRGLGRLELSRLLPHAGHTVARNLAPLQHWFVQDAVVHSDEVAQFCFTLGDLPADAATGRGAVAEEEAEGGGSSCHRTASLTVTATLVWDDPATAVEGSVHSQVHDLDLVLVTQHGEALFSGGGGTAPDRHNTVEQVRVPMTVATTAAAAAGRLSVREWASGFRALVRGEVVRTSAGQTFALAVSGPGLTPLANCTSLFDQWRGSRSVGSTPQPTTEATGTTNGSGASAFCPMNCTGRGACDPGTLLCVCDSNYTGVDCAECNADVLCHGHGTCKTDGMTCSCDPRGHFADAFCAVCERGWYGPGCASNCSCLHGGVCDTASGLCSCPQDTSRRGRGAGCFQGPQCQYCCEGFGGPACNQRSYWCNTSGETVTVDDPEGGLIQINDYGSYPYSLTCRWAIQGKPGQQVQLEFVSYSIERYDTLYIYDVLPTAGAANATGTGAPPPEWRLLRNVSENMADDPRAAAILTSTAEQMYLTFVSDWAGTAPGFVLRYRFTSCSERCRLTNLTGPVGHWQCGDALGLPAQQCICKPPYVGWSCNQDSAEILPVLHELSDLQLSGKRAWQEGGLAWMVPRSALTAAEVRLPVRLGWKATLPLRPALSNWRSSLAAAGDVAQLSFPVSGMARLPLIAHGLSEVQLPLLTLPTAAAPWKATATTDGAALPTRVLTAHVRLAIQLQVETTWLDKYARTLGLTLGVSAATEVAGAAAGEIPSAVPYNVSSRPLSLTNFTFTPMALQRLVDCAGQPVVEVVVPLALLTDVPTPPSRRGNATAAPATTSSPAETQDVSHWTARVIVTLLWSDEAGVQVPEEVMVEAAVVARRFIVSSLSVAAAADAALPAAGSTVRGRPLELTCQPSEAPLPVRTGQQVTEAAALARANARKVTSAVRFLVVFVALCVGIVGGALWALRCQERPRTMYMSVQSTEDGQDMQVIGKRG